jgi:hypothetical protein
MKRALVVLLSVLAVMSALALPVLAINFGTPDGGEHPYVGTVIFTSDGEDLYQCSGTLIAPDVFLTAGHCAVDATWAWVTFAESPDYANFPDGWLTGHGVAHPDFGDFALPNTNDVGVILLDRSVAMPTYGVLAPLGYLDSYKNKLGLQDTRFEPVGYGVNSYKPVFEWVGDRYKGEQRIINLVNALADGYNVMLTNNPGKGNGVGGTCSGDSGGPILVNNSNMIIGINSFGMAPWCKGNDYAYRADILNTYEFLDQFVDVLP